MTNELLRWFEYNIEKYIFLILCLILSSENYGWQTGKLSNQVLSRNPQQFKT